MKKILVAAIIILFSAGVNAQAGMPKELTCTEEAFNFSFNLGAKWKLSTPKMGPAEIIRNGPDYIPALALKINNEKTGTDLVPALKQNYPSPYYHNTFSAANKLEYASPIINFDPYLNYTILKPYFLSSLGERYF